MRFFRTALLVTICAVLTAVVGFGVANLSRGASSTAGGKQTLPQGAETPAPPSSGPLASQNGAAPAVGALFAGDSHYCSASVVHSPAGNQVLTAAHCIHDGAGGDYLSGLTFAPGYHDGTAPYGMWTVTKALVAPDWITGSDPNVDVGFMTVHQDGNPRSIESITGANQLGIDRGFGNQITLVGYPDDTESPMVCQNTTGRQAEYQMRVACAGFPDGTSGGPWVVGADPVTGLGTVIGATGGYRLGGDPDVSYSSYFDKDVQALYRASTSQTQPESG